MNYQKHLIMAGFILLICLPSTASIVENLGRTGDTFFYSPGDKGVRVLWCGKRLPTPDFDPEGCVPYGQQFDFAKFRDTTVQGLLQLLGRVKSAQETVFDKLRWGIDRQIEEVSAVEGRIKDNEEVLKDLNPKSRNYDAIVPPLKKRIADLEKQKEKLRNQIEIDKAELARIAGLQPGETPETAIELVYGQKGLFFDEKVHSFLAEAPKDDAHGRARAIIRQFARVAAIALGQSFGPDAWVDFEKKVVWRMSGNAVEWDEARRRCPADKGYRFLDPGEDEIPFTQRDAITPQENTVRVDLVRVIEAFDRGETTFVKMPEKVWGARIPLRRDLYEVGNAYFFRLPLLGTSHVFNDRVNDGLSLEGQRWLGKQMKEFRAHILCYKPYTP